MHLSDPTCLGSRRREHCFCSFYSCLFGCLPNSQMNHTWSLNLNYECLAWNWLVTNQLFLPSTFCLWSFIFSYFCVPFLYFLFHGLLCSWMADPCCPPVLVLLLLLSNFSSYFFPLPDSPAYPSSALLFAIRLFIRLSGILERQRITASQS